MNYWSCFSEI